MYNVSLDIGNASEAVVQRCSVKKVLVNISQNPQKNNCARVSFLLILFKKRLCHGCFPVSFFKKTYFYKTPLVAAAAAAWRWAEIFRPKRRAMEKYNGLVEKLK